MFTICSNQFETVNTITVGSWEHDFLMTAIALLSVYIRVGFVYAAKYDNSVSSL